jgi:hypothetical protein
MTIDCYFYCSLHLRSALVNLLLVLVMLLSGYLMFALLIGKPSLHLLAFWCLLKAIRVFHVPHPIAYFSFIIIFNSPFQCCRNVYMARPHAPRTEKVVGIGFQPGFDPHKVYKRLLVLCIAMLCILFPVAQAFLNM